MEIERGTYWKARLVCHSVIQYSFVKVLFHSPRIKWNRTEITFIDHQGTLGCLYDDRFLETYEEMGRLDKLIIFGEV